MNKFLLCVFVVLAFGCHPDYINGLPTTTTSTTSPETAGDVFELVMVGFSKCNIDGTEGLTFYEINYCRVNILHDTQIHSYREHFGILETFMASGVFLA